MSGKHLTPAQEIEMEKIKKQWLEEARPYIDGPPQEKAMLDGSSSTALALIQAKYQKRIQEVLEASE